MSFIRQHLFLVTLAAVVLIVAPIELYIKFSNGSKVAKKIQQREELAKDLQSLRGTGVNEDIVKAKEDEGELMTGQYALLVKEANDFNRVGLAPLMVTIRRGGAIEQVPAFPWKPEYPNLSVDWNFPLAYEQAMKDLAKQLGPTEPPTDRQIGKVTGRIIMQKEQEQRVDSSADVSPTILPAGFGDQGGRGGMIGRGAGMYVGPTAPGAIAPEMGLTGIPAATEQTDTDVVDPQLAEEEAIRTLMVRQARAGTMYASWKRSFDLVFFGTSKAPEMTQLWQAQLGYWLQKDLVEAIRLTNDEYFREREDQLVRRQQSRELAGQVVGPAEKLKRNVLTAAVKRLVSVRITEHVGAPSVGPGSTGAAPGGREIRVGPAGGFIGPQGRGGGTQSAAAKAALQSLTGRKSNTDYDVYTFEITLVMNPALLDRFVENLYKENLYTVLEESWTKTDLIGVNDTSMSTRAYPDAAGDTDIAPSELLYYYGTDPVMAVTLKVEAIFLADWFRDMMPTEVLEGLSSDILRTQDIERAGVKPAAK